MNLQTFTNISNLAVIQVSSQLVCWSIEQSITQPLSHLVNSSVAKLLSYSIG